MSTMTEQQQGQRSQRTEGWRRISYLLVMGEEKGYFLWFAEEQLLGGIRVSKYEVQIGASVD